MFVIHIVENQKTKAETAISRPTETMQKQKSEISLPLPAENPSPPAIAKPTVEEEENYPPVIKRKQKDPKPQELDVVKQLKDICYTVDPNDIYKDMIKIGQGYLYKTHFRFNMIKLNCLSL